MTALERLQSLLRELFQYDLADLDFGIYCLLRLKRQEVDAFLTEQLPRHVDEAFAAGAGHERTALDRDIAALRERIRAEIADDALLPAGDLKPDHREQKAKVARDLVEQYEAARARLRDIEITESQKADVFNHLYGFFSRYYEGGDFVPRRRYGAREAYAVPYNGEEVLLHWANRGQHHVKNTETFRHYSFAVDTVAGSCRVRFVIAEASVPPGDTKGDTRYFFPIPAGASWDESIRTFRLPFHSLTRT